jgi:16S rRNA (adenine1518-N6/adenine1519-N6)-dimethyltransferase
MRPRKRFGQHWLEPAWADKVVNAIAPLADQTFLEIGPGRGALTTPLAARAGRVVAVEIDRDLVRALERRRITGLEVITGDLLDLDLTALPLPPGTRVVGNLPYNVSSPILLHVLAAQELSGAFADATFMLQKEVADRLVAEPGTKDYGVLTIFAALAARVSMLLTLPPGAFRPMPAVHSAVVRLEFAAAGARRRAPAGFARLVRGLFTQRRKTLLNGLRALIGDRAAAALEATGLDGRRRAETLSVGELIGLASALDRVHGLDPPVPHK